MIDFNSASSASVPAYPPHRWDIANDPNPAGTGEGGVPSVVTDAEGRRASGRVLVPAFDAPRQSKFTVESFDTLTPLAQGWRVKGLWPATGLCFVAGASMSGKSFWVLDSLAKVCLGRPVLGRKANACGVLYIASEGPNGVRVRVTGLRSHVGTLDGRFAFIGQAPNLTDLDDITDLRATIMEEKASMAGRGHTLGMVVIDTLSASIPGADENSAKDMSPVLSALQALAQELELLVVVIAHTGKNEDRGMRGWSGLLANADGVIMLDSPDDDGLRVGKVTKVKDGESGDRFAFRLGIMPVGVDEDGDPITTCIVEEATVPPPNGSSKPLTGGALTSAQALADLIAKGLTHPAPSVAGVRAGQRAVKIEEWKVRAGEMGLFDQDDTANNRRQKWHSAKLKILAKGMVRIEGEWAILQ